MQKNWISYLEMIQTNADSTTRPKLLPGGNPFETDCRTSNYGGGLPEKIARFRRLREYALELNEDIGNITTIEAMKDQMWNAPSYKTRKVQQIQATKKWNIPSNIFPANKATVENECTEHSKTCSQCGIVTCFGYRR